MQVTKNKKRKLKEIDIIEELQHFEGMRVQKNMQNVKMKFLFQGMRILVLIVNDVLKRTKKKDGIFTSF